MRQHRLPVLAPRAEADGRVEHRTQFLSTTPQEANYYFVRALQAALGLTGTVFMWSPHESSTVNAILDELGQDPAPPPDAAALGSFIRSLTTRKAGDGDVEAGNRALADLCRLAEKAFFHPATKGSNSIKKVLPAVMQSSEYLKRKYSRPIYGAMGGIQSLNFVDHVWWQEVGGAVVDPYRLLPPVFTDLPREVVDALEVDVPIWRSRRVAPRRRPMRVCSSKTSRHRSGDRSRRRCCGIASWIRWRWRWSMTPGGSGPREATDQLALEPW